MHTGESLRVVLNTSPIIVLAKLELLKEALNLFDEVEVPSGVLEEVKRKGNNIYQEITRIINEGRMVALYPHR